MPVRFRAVRRFRDIEKLTSGRAIAVSVHMELSEVLLTGLRVVVSERGRTTSIELDGEYDLAAETETREAVRRALARDPECVVLDLSRVSFIDSSGIHAVVELAQCSTAQHVRLVIIPGPKAVQRMFELCRLTEVLPFVGEL